MVAEQGGMNTGSLPRTLNPTICTREYLSYWNWVKTIIFMVKENGRALTFVIWIHIYSLRYKILFVSQFAMTASLKQVGQLMLLKASVLRNNGGGGGNDGKRD